MDWKLFWLFLHILGAVLAFGPVFTFPIIGGMLRSEPRHIPFALRVQERISRRLVAPLAISMAVSGAGLVIAESINLRRTPWLGAGIILYVVAVAIAFGILIPTGARMVAMSGAMPAPAPDAAPSGPPPEFLALIRRAQIFGGVTQLLFVVILALMVWQPGGVVTGAIFG